MTDGATADLFEEPDESQEGPSPVTDAREARFGRYRLRYQLASGGMASVYLARVLGPAGFEKLVAIKRMHPHLAKRKSFVEMFLDEARITSRINHPNVCSVIDFGEVDGTYFIAMEYLMGESLNRVVRTAADIPREVTSKRWQAFSARIVADAAEGLHAAHELRDERSQLLNVVHRDVSPQNVIVTYDGAVHVVDFGVAFAENRLHHTTTGTVKGKYAYMAPEQVAGAKVDRRADVWSLGVCLWEMLCGKRLFRRPDVFQTIRAVESETIAPPSHEQPGVPPALDEIVMGALEREPVRRTPSARAMSRQLREFLLSFGEAAGLPEVSEWMGLNYSEGRSKKHELVHTALHESVSHAGRLDQQETRILNEANLTPNAQPDLGTEQPDSAGSDGALGSAAGFMSGVPTVIKDSPTPPPAGTTTPLPPSAQAHVPDGPPRFAMPDTPDPGPARRRRRWFLAIGGAALISGGIIALVSLRPTLTPLGENPPSMRPAAPSPPPSETAMVAPPAPAVPAEPALPSPAPESEPVPEPAGQAEASSASEEQRRAARNERRRRRRAAAQRSTADMMSAARSGGQGRAAIRTSGQWADIYENGRRLGRTPRELTMPAGRHVLELRPNGQAPGRRVVVDVPADGVVRVSVSL